MYHMKVPKTFTPSAQLSGQPLTHSPPTSDRPRPGSARPRVEREVPRVAPDLAQQWASFQQNTKFTAQVCVRVRVRVCLGVPISVCLVCLSGCLALGVRLPARGRPG